jgi:hypothetical protein
MTVPRLVIKCSHDAAQRAALKTGRCWRGRQAPRDCQRGPLLTGCSQTVRIHLDVAAHVGGEYAGQVHTGGRICTWWGRVPWSGGIEGVVVNLSDVLELVASG